MPLCVLIYGGCQYQQNVIYCIKMRILLLLWPGSHERFTAQNISTHINKPPLSLSVEVKAMVMYVGDSGITVIRMQRAINADKLTESAVVLHGPAVSLCPLTPGYLHHK